MKVKVAETAGFCFGVKRAVDKVYELIDTEQKPIFTLGPIIHNEGVVADLEARGVHVITEADLDSPDDILQSGTVVIRSHGVGKPIYDKLKEKNISYVDVTCPFVLKIHRINGEEKDVFQAHGQRFLHGEDQRLLYLFHSDDQNIRLCGSGFHREFTLSAANLQTKLSCVGHQRAPVAAQMLRVAQPDRAARLHPRLQILSFSHSHSISLGLKDIYEKHYSKIIQLRKEEMILFLAFFPGSVYNDNRFLR